jgi:uncharacterized membrane protein YagU involved in acid resistance
VRSSCAGKDSTIHNPMLVYMVDIRQEQRPSFIFAIEYRLTDLNIVSRWDRMLIFGACNLGAAVCFMICFFLFPVLTLKPRKFAVL